MSGKRESAHKKCRRSLQRHEHRTGRGLAGCSRARATTAPHDVAEAQAGVCSDSDSEESETGSDGEWSGDDDPLSDHGREDEDEDEPVLRGHVRRHAITQAVTVRMRSTTSGASRWLWARRAGRGACVVWARVVARTWSSCLGARSTAATRMAHSTGPPPRCSSPRTTSTITVLRCGRWTTCTCTARDCKVGLFGDFCEARWAWQVR